MTKYYLARAKDNEIRKAGECGGAVTALFKYLLENEIVDGVLGLRKGKDIYDGIPTLITDPKELTKISGSLHCAPTMFADLISKYLQDLKLAVSVKPCDAMAIKELQKRKQIENELYLIGLNCGGTLRPIPAREMIKLFYKVDPDDVIKEEIARGKFIIELKDGSHKEISIDDLEEKGYGRRDMCQRCEMMIPRNADVACGNWGADEGWTFIEVVTEKGKKLVENAINDGFIEVKSPSDKAITIRSKIEKSMIKMAKNFKEKYLDKEYPKLEDWEKYFKRCIKCYACRDVCPICFCEECELEKEWYKEPENVPPNPLTFHGIRLWHMGFSCINCGQCEDVCPMDIPVARLFHKIQEKYRKETGFVPGVDEELPPMYSPEKI